MKLPKFSIVEASKDLPGAGIILHGEEKPFHFAKILKFGSLEDMTLSLSNARPFIYKEIPGYSIIIRLAGSMEGKIYISAEGTTNLERLVKEMAAWYFETYIKDNNKFKKYKL